MQRLPSQEQMIAYAAGELSPEQSAVIRAQLAADPTVAAEAERLTAIIRTMRSDDSRSAPVETITSAKSIFRPRLATAGASWWETAARAIAALVFDSRVQPALAGFRSGGGAGFQMAFETDDIGVDLQFEPTDESRSSWQVIGQVSTDGVGPDADIAITAQAAERTVCDAQADESGVFRFELARGGYDVFIRVHGRVLVLPGIQVG